MALKLCLLLYYLTMHFKGETLQKAITCPPFGLLGGGLNGSCGMGKQALVAVFQELSEIFI